MIKRTPQEIADFFGCYVAQDGIGNFKAYSEKPEFVLEDERYGVRNVWVMANKPEGVFEYITNLVDAPKYHDFHILYEPHLPDSAPHQSEVYTHREYVLLAEFDPSLLVSKVNEYLDKGYTLYGNPWTGPNDSYGYLHYQAMLR